MDNKEKKQEIRRIMRAIKKEIGKEVLLEMSSALCSSLIQHKQYINAKTIMLYAALWDEVNLDIVLKDALNNGKRVIYPTVVGDDIIPVEITKDTIWSVGDFGILEPQADKYIGPFDTIIVPGVAFDKKGNRLGRGKGYYDRFLAMHLDSYRIGICFQFQIQEEIPTESFDLTMNEIIDK